MERIDERTLFGFIAHILKQLSKERLYYGTVVVQKIVYFLQNAYGVDLPYKFYFYHFGPYDDTLDTQLRIMKIYGLIDIGSDPKGIGYSIEVKEEKVEEYIKAADDFVEEHKEKVKSVLNLFGNRPPSDLELEATIHFVFRNHKGKFGNRQIKDTVIQKVKTLKPKFTKKQIESEYDLLLEQKVLA